MIRQYIENAKEQANFGLITKRDRSEVFKIRYDGQFYCLKILTDDERFTHTYEQAYSNYCCLRDKRNLVHVYDFWRSKESGKFFVVMEYLEGYRRLEYYEMDTRIRDIEESLFRQGYFMIDIAPINLMVKDKDIKMVDLDTLSRVTDYPVDPKQPISELSWYGSRVLKYRTGRVK